MKISKKTSILLISLVAVITLGVSAAVGATSPDLSIESEIPAAPNSMVEIPVSFAPNGNDISSAVFSIDYDQAMLEYDSGIADTFNFLLSADFIGSCTVDETDTDGEIDCFIIDPAPPLASLPTGEILIITLRTLDPGGTVTTPVLFSDDPPASFGDNEGQSVPGTTQDGSVKIGVGLGDWEIYLPNIAEQPTSTPTPTPTATKTPEGTETQTTPTKTPTPTPTKTPKDSQPTATATQKSTTCDELIANGGFENNNAWVIPATVYSARYSNAKAHDGSRSLLTGITDLGDNRYSYSSVYQTVTIPNNIDSATLTFWNYPQSGETEALWALPFATHYMLGMKPFAFDMQYVALIDVGNGDQPIVWWQLSNRNTWAKETIDLTDYEGRTIQIWFTSYNDGADGVTSMYLDDVSLEVCD